MPATRSSSQQPKRNAQTSPSPRRNPRKRPSDPYELSSDGESILSPTRKRVEKAQPPRRQPKVPAIDSEVIEISSGEESSPQPSQAKVVADFRRQINKLREESVKNKRDYERASKELKELREENQQLNMSRNPGQGKLVFDATQLTDALDCEICTSRMWTPYILPDCGHTFCQSCLQDWFSTILAQFVGSHPAYDVNNPYQQAPHLQVLLSNLAHSPQILANPHLAGMIETYLPAQPVYTCPTCREPVRSPPTEAFILKSLVRTISAAAGETSPKKPTSGNRKGKATANAVGPWDGFFPRKKT